MVRNPSLPNHLQENMFLFVSNSHQTSPNEFNIKALYLHCLELLVSCIYCVQLARQNRTFGVIFHVISTTLLFVQKL